MKVILNEQEIEAINKVLKKQSIDFTHDGYQYFNVPVDSALFGSFFDEIQISVLVQVDNGVDLEYCTLVDNDQNDSMEIENYDELELFENIDLIKLIF